MSLTPRTRVPLALVLAALAAPACHRRDDRPLVARVAGVPIYVDEFKRELKRLKLEDSSGGTPSALDDSPEKRALLDDLVRRRLLLQEVERANVIVGTDEVEAAFARARAGWDPDEFNTNLTERDLTPAEFKNDLREDLLIRKYFRDHVFSRVAVTDGEIEAYITAHPEVMLEPERVRALHLALKTQEEADRVATEIKAGLAFEDAAMKYSLTPDAKSGGVVGLVPRGVMPKAFDEACFNLPVGQVSKVVADENGFYLFKVLERRPQAVKPIEDVREQVETLVRRDKERTAEETKLAELRKAAVIEIQEEQLARIH
jgi:parvulin-like peptidyl-prolyl isomerase